MGRADEIDALCQELDELRQDLAHETERAVATISASARLRIRVDAAREDSERTAT